ncbi:5597_t:CDS:1, partial [Funneliformis caledonium]
SSDSWIKAAKEIQKLERFFNQQVKLMQESFQDKEEETFILIWLTEDMILNLKKNLKKNFNEMLAKEYIKKRFIFEYLVYLLNEKKKIKASIDVINMIYNSNSKLKAIWIQQT